MRGKTKKSIVRMVVITMAICFLGGLSGCKAITADNSGDRKLSTDAKPQSKSIDVAIRSGDSAGSVPELKQESFGAGNSNGNNWSGNDSYDYSDDLLSKGDVLALYSNCNRKSGSYFIYEGRGDDIKRENLVKIAFWSLGTGLIMLVTGIFIGANNNRKIKSALKYIEDKTDQNGDGKFDAKDIEIIKGKLK